MATKKKFLGIQSGFDEGFDPFGGDQQQQFVEEGPTEYDPWRYTEHSTNIQGSSAAGRNVQGMQGRSMFMGLGPSRPGTEDLFDDRLPQKEVKIAMGNLDSYEGQVPDPYSIRGRMAIAELPDYQGQTETTKVFDMQRIGEGMGLTEDQISSIINPEHDVVYSSINSASNKDGGSQVVGDWGTADEWQARYDENQPTFQDRINAGKDFDPTDYPTNFHPDPQNFASRDYVDPATYEGLDVDDDELAVFLGLSNLSDSGNLKFDLDNPYHLDAVYKTGKSDIARSNLDLPGEYTGRYDALAGDKKSLLDQQDYMNTAFDKSDDKPDPWKEAFHTGLKLAVIGGLTYGVGTVAAPVAGAYLGPTASAAATGAVSGATSSVLSQTFMNPGQPLDFENIGVSAAVGGVGGAGLGMYNQGRQAATGVESSVGTLTDAGAAKSLAASSVMGGVEGYQRGEGAQGVIDQNKAAYAHEQMGVVSQIKEDTLSAQASWDNTFGIGRREADPYMDFDEDIYSGQGDIV